MNVLSDFIFKDSLTLEQYGLKVNIALGFKCKFYRTSTRTFVWDLYKCSFLNTNDM